MGAVNTTFYFQLQFKICVPFITIYDKLIHFCSKSDIKLCMEATRNYNKLAGFSESVHIILSNNVVFLHTIIKEEPSI